MAGFFFLHMHLNNQNCCKNVVGLKGSVVEAKTKGCSG